MTLNGQPIMATQTYRVVTNNFLAGGGDSFFGFKTGTNRVTIGSDIDALEAYFKNHSPITPAIKGRIKKVE